MTPRRTVCFTWAFVVALLGLVVLTPVAASEPTRVSTSAIAAGDWLSFGRTPDNNRNSPLTQITTSNVTRLKRDYMVDFAKVDPASRRAAVVPAGNRRKALHDDERRQRLRSRRRRPGRSSGSTSRRTPGCSRTSASSRIAGSPTATTGCSSRSSTCGSSRSTRPPARSSRRRR